MPPPVPPPRSVISGSQRSYSTYSNPSVFTTPRAVSDDRNSGALTGVSGMCGRSGRSVVTKIGPDLIQRLQARQPATPRSCCLPLPLCVLAAGRPSRPAGLWSLRGALTDVPAVWTGRIPGGELKRAGPGGFARIRRQAA
jgi:hypothetical protein